MGPEDADVANSPVKRRYVIDEETIAYLIVLEAMMIHRAINDAVHMRIAIELRRNLNPGTLHRNIRAYRELLDPFIRGLKKP